MEKIYRDADVSMKPLEGKTVAVIGYGIQGKAQAANARDSKVKVIIGTRPPEESPSRAQAKADGFEGYCIAEAAKRHRKPKELSSSGSSQPQNTLFSGTGSGSFRQPYYYYPPQQPYYGARPPYNPYPTWGQPPLGGCASSAPCASACLGQQWQRPW